MSVETDSHGRLYLSADLRDRYGERFHVVEYADRIELIPVDDDPLQAIRDEVGDAFEGESVEEIREKARQRAREEATNDLGPRGGSGKLPRPEGHGIQHGLPINPSQGRR